MKFGEDHCHGNNLHRSTEHSGVRDVCMVDATQLDFGAFSVLGATVERV